MKKFNPNISVSLWKQRLTLTKQVKNFFEQRGVLEVDTPILSQSSALDPAIDVFYADYFVDGNLAYQKDHPKRYLSTSPEFCMKRLLASGFPDIFQIAKAFRNGEAGERHNPEFSILEWYRIGWLQVDLMNEVFELVKEFLDVDKFSNITYREAFMTFAGFDPFNTSFIECVEFCKTQNMDAFDCFSNLADILDYILGFYICPKLGEVNPQFLIEWPAEQAALAKTFDDEHGNHVAARFELFYKGLELCNGYQELTDSSEQERRFKEDISERASQGKCLLKQDDNFLNALKSGMPECSGVALGLDRLFMLALKKNSIKEVLLFSDNNC